MTLLLATVIGGMRTEEGSILGPGSPVKSHGEIQNRTNLAGVKAFKIPEEHMKKILGKM